MVVPIRVFFIKHDDLVNDVIDSIISRSIREDDLGSVHSNRHLSVSRFPEWNRGSTERLEPSTHRHLVVVDKQSVRKHMVQQDLL